MNHESINQHSKREQQTTLEISQNIESILANSQLFNIKNEIEQNMLFNMSKKLIRSLRVDSFGVPNRDRLKTNKRC
jgi:hypothetical protein